MVDRFWTEAMMGCNRILKNGEYCSRDAMRDVSAMEEKRPPKIFEYCWQHQT